MTLFDTVWDTFDTTGGKSSYQPKRAHSPRPRTSARGGPACGPPVDRSCRRRQLHASRLQTVISDGEKITYLRSIRRSDLRSGVLWLGTVFHIVQDVSLTGRLYVDLRSTKHKIRMRCSCFVAIRGGLSWPILSSRPRDPNSPEHQPEPISNFDVHGNP